MTTLRKPFENIVGKGENAGNQHFLLFSTDFCTSKNKIQRFGNSYFVVCKCSQFGRLSSCLVNPFPNKPLFLHVCSLNFFENTVGKGEIALKVQFLLFPPVFFYPFGELPFLSILKLSSANSQFARVLNQSFGKG